MTGRAMGYCAGYDVPGFLNGPSGRGGFGGRGMGGRGFGRGWRHRYYAAAIPGPPVGRFPYSAYPAMRPADELKALEEEATLLERSLEQVKRRLEELRGEKE